MTAEQKLEKCKELVKEWRGIDYSTDPPYEDDDSAWVAAHHECADALQAILEETDED